MDFIPWMTLFTLSVNNKEIAVFYVFHVASELVYKSLMPPPSRDGVRRMWTTRTLRPRPGPVG